jgi:Polyketide cyclase / dehydrase and lipid transport
MASIRKEILIDAPPEHVWDAIRDFGAVHERLVPGFVVDSRLDGDDRIVTFFSGAVQRNRSSTWTTWLADSSTPRSTHRSEQPITTRPCRSSPTARLEAGSSGSSTSCPAGSAPPSTGSWTEERRR